MANRRRLLRTTKPEQHVELREADESFLLWMRRSVIVLIVVAGAVEFFKWGISPFNWIGLVVVVHLAHWIEKHVFKSPEPLQAIGHPATTNTGVQPAGPASHNP